MTLDEQVANLTAQTATLLAAINIQKNYLDNAVAAAAASATAAAGTTFSIPNLSSITPNIGVLRTTNTGGRMEIRDNTIKVFNENNILVFQIGDLTV